MHRAESSDDAGRGRRCSPFTVTTDVRPRLPALTSAATPRRAIAASSTRREARHPRRSCT